MAQQRYSGYPCQVTHAGGALTFVQLGGVSIASNAAHTEEFPSGQLYRTATILSHGDPAIGIRTADFATIVAAVGIQTGLKCYAGNSIFQAQQRADGSTFSGAGTNTIFTCTKGFLTIQSISARQDAAEGAQLGMVFQPLWDGTNEPIVQTLAQNLTGTPSFASQFYMGPVFYQGSQVEGVQGFQLDTGVRFVPKRADGDPFARKGSIVQVEPRLRVMLDGTVVAAATAKLFNSSTAGGNVDVYLRKGIHGGSREANANIRIRFGTASSHISEHSAEGLADAMWNWDFRPHADLALATGVADP